MPFFSYRCTACAAEFEALVRSDDIPTCPTCQSDKLDRLLAAPLIGGRTEAAFKGFRAQAAREGHFSNFSPSELKRR